MFIAVDVGNTQTAIGLYESAQTSEARAMWRVATDARDTADELRAQLAMLFAMDGIEAASLDGAAVASVVPRMGASWGKALSCAGCAMVVSCTAETAGHLFQTDYPNPSEIGADRVADAIAVRALYGSPAVVVDFGTATNIEVIDKQGRFVGGIIAPGVETSASALFSHATKIATVGLADPGAAIGRSTEQAVLSGVVYGEAERVDGLVRRVFEQLGYRAPVIATGGLAETMAGYSREITETNPELTLEGLRLLFAARERESALQ